MTLRIVDWDKNFENNRTKDMKVMQWVPIPNKMDGLGYLTLVDHPNGAQHFAAWVAIIEIASRQKVRGTLPQVGAGIPQALARISRLPAGIFEECIPRLLEIQWIEPLESACGETAGIPHLPARKGREGKEENGMEEDGSERATRVATAAATKPIPPFEPQDQDRQIEALASDLMAAHPVKGNLPAAVTALVHRLVGQPNLDQQDVAIRKAHALWRPEFAKRLDGGKFVPALHRWISDGDYLHPPTDASESPPGPKKPLRGIDALNHIREQDRLKNVKT